MSIQILGGHAKGHALFVPKGHTIRPTSVMLRRKFFDAHQFFDGVFIDLCAGTGAMGLEALSRGASKVYLNELQPKVFQLLKKNVSGMNKYLLNNVEVTKGDALKVLSILKGHYLNDDNAFFFFDPPYEMINHYKKFLSEFKQGHKCQLWIESDRQKGIKKEDVEKHGFNIIKEYRQGTSFILRVQAIVD